MRRIFLEVVVVWLLVMATGCPFFIFYHLWQGQTVTLYEYNPVINVVELLASGVTFLAGIIYLVVVIRRLECR